MLTRRHAVLAAIESAEGIDAIDPLPAAQRDSLGIEVFDITPTTARELIDVQTSSDSLSNDLQPVGFGSGGLAFSQHWKGSGAANRAPHWGRQLRACGFRETRGLDLKLTNIEGYHLSGSYQPGGRIGRGQRLIGNATLTSATWDDAPGSGSGTGTAPSVGDRVVFFAPNQSLTEPRARGTVSTISGTIMLVKLDDLDFGMPQAGDYVADEAGAGFNTLGEGLPIGVVVDHNLPDANATDGDVIIAELQGNWPAVTQVHGTLCDVRANVDTITPGHGFLYMPDSQKTLCFSATPWTSGPPLVGHEVAVHELGGQVKAAGKVVSVSGDQICIEPYFGEMVMGETLVDITAQPSSAAPITTAPVLERTPSETLWSNLDGLLRRYTGTRGTFTLSLEAGQPGVLAFTMQGTPQQPRTEPLASLPSSAVIAPTWANGHCDIDGDAKLRTNTATLDVSNTVTRIVDANSPEATAGYDVTARTPTLALSVQRPGLAVLPAEDKLRMGATLAIGIQVGHDPLNRVALVVPRGQVTALADADQDGIYMLELTLACRRMARDDEIIIASLP